MRCSELLRLSHMLLPAPAFPPPGRHRAFAVAEVESLGV